METHDSGSGVLQMNNPRGFNIPNWFPRMDLAIELPKYDKVVLKSDARCIVVIEDGGLFNLLRQTQFCKKFASILVCAHGLPDMDTIAFVWWLCSALNFMHSEYSF